MTQISPTIQRQALGLLLAVATFALLSWRLTRPAMWLDESASAIATERTWPNLWILLHSPEAPLVPYYALLKVLSAATVQLVPQTAGQIELLFRWPSVAVSVLAAWLLTVWLARFCPTPVVLGAGVFLLAGAGFSRYGTEARPYAMVLLLAVCCTVIWTHLVGETRTRRRWLWISLYALTVVLLICANSLTASLILAHLVAAAVAPERGRRMTAVLSTFAAGAIGTAIVAPLALVMATQGKGATKYPLLRPDALAQALVRLFTIGPHRLFWVGALLPLAALGISRVNSPKYRFIARLATAWALVPPVLWVFAIVARPNLLLGRYVLFILPACAILAGLGTVTVFELLQRGVQRLTGQSAATAKGAAWAATTVLLAALVVSQLQSLQLPRNPGGHGDDIRPALALADSPRFANLPIFPSSQLGAIEISSYDRRDERRMIGMSGQRNQHFIWPVHMPYDLRKAQLKAAPRLVLLMRISAAKDCGVYRMERTVQDIYRCMPAVLRRMHYRVEWFNRNGRAWTFAVMYRGGEPPWRPVQQPPGQAAN